MSVFWAIRRTGFHSVVESPNTLSDDFFFQA